MSRAKDLLKKLLEAPGDGYEFPPDNRPSAPSETPRHSYNVSIDYVERVIARFDLASSSHVHYADQADKWKRIAASLGLSLEELAGIIANAAKNESYHGLQGIEGLYMLTKNSPEGKALYRVTDFGHAADTDQLAVSYFYGSPERREAWQTYASNRPEVMASSIAAALDGHARGNVVTDITTNVWEPREVVDGLLAGGWDIEYDENAATIVVHGMRMKNRSARPAKGMHQPMESKEISYGRLGRRN